MVLTPVPTFDIYVINMMIWVLSFHYHEKHVDGCKIKLAHLYVHHSLTQTLTTLS